MYKVSGNYKQQITASDRYMTYSGKITLSDKTEIPIAPSSIVGGTLYVDSKAVNHNEFSVGGCYSSELGLGYFSDSADNISFMNAEIEISANLELPDGSLEAVPLGIFRVDDVSKEKNATYLKALDRMILFDKSYPYSKVSGKTPFDLVSQACSECGVALENSSFSEFANSNLSLSTEENQISTYRDLIGMVCEILGAFSIINRSGKLELRKFASTPVCEYTNFFTSTPRLSDSEITIGRVVYNTISSGDGENSVVIPNNSFLETMEESEIKAVLDNIYSQLSNVSFYSGEISTFGDPALDQGDTVSIRGKNVILMGYTWRFRGIASISSYGDNSTSEVEYDSVKKLAQTVSDNYKSLRFRMDDKYASLEASVDGFKAEVSRVESTANEALESVDNLEVGGRNYLLDSATERSLTRITSNTTLYYGFSDELLSIDGTEFVFSFDAKSEADGKFYLDFYFRNSSASITQLGHELSPQVMCIDSTDYKHYSMPVIFKDEYTCADIVNCNVRFWNGSGTVTFKNAKLEKGNKATDWTPAPEDVDKQFQKYSTTVEMNSAIEQKANSIMTTVSETFDPTLNQSGSLITLTDSAELPLVGLTLHGNTTQGKTTGKNLLENQLTSETVNGLTISVNTDGSITVNGTSTASFSRALNNNITLSAGKYTISGGKETNARLEFRANKSDGSTIALSDTGKGATVTITEDVTSSNLIVVFISGTTFSNYTFYPMIRLVSVTDTTYEPYTGGIPSPNPNYPQPIDSVENPVVKITGKNLIEVTATTTTVQGITFTVNDDGSVVVNGTAVADATIRICSSITLPIGRYTLTGCPLGGSTSTYDVRYGTSGATRDTGSGVSFSITEEANSYVAIVVRGGVTVNNLTFKPMIRLASIEDSTYEPYKSQTLSVPYTLNGIGDIKDYVDFEKGVWVQKCAKVVIDENTQMGSTASFTILGNYARCQVILKTGNAPAITNTISGWCNIMPYKSDYSSDILHFYAHNNVIWVFLPIAELSTQDNAGAKAWLIEHNAEFIYVRNTPTETPLTDEELEAYKQLHTYKPNTVITNSEGADMDVIYVNQTYSDMQGNLEQRVTKAEATLEVQAGKIEAKVDVDGVISAINLAKGEATINANKINFNGMVTANETFKILEDGSMEATGGTIGGWDIGEDELSSTFEVVGEYFTTVSLKSPKTSGGNILQILTEYYSGTGAASMILEFLIDSHGNAVMGDIRAGNIKAKNFERGTIEVTVSSATVYVAKEIPLSFTPTETTQCVLSLRTTGSPQPRYLNCWANYFKASDTATPLFQACLTAGGSSATTVPAGTYYIDYIAANV